MSLEAMACDDGWQLVLKCRRSFGGMPSKGDTLVLDKGQNGPLGREGGVKRIS